MQSPKKSCYHLVIIPASEIQYMAYHVPYPFHQDSNFFYFTGLNEPNGIFLVCKNETEGNENDACWSTHLFLEMHNKHAEIWNGPTLTLSEASSLTGIKHCYPLYDLRSFLHHQVASSSSLCVWYSPLSSDEPFERPQNKFVLGNISKFLKEINNKNVSFENPEYIIDNLRFKKSNYEIRQMKLAVVAAIESLESAMQITKPGITETSLQSHIEYQMRSRGCSVGYPPVVAGGYRTNIIHYMRNNSEIRDGELILVDAGCRVNGYTSDITRTWPVNVFLISSNLENRLYKLINTACESPFEYDYLLGYFSPTQKIVHEILLEIQKSCASVASPEKSLQDLYNHMLSEIGRHLVNERIIPDQDKLYVAQKVCPHHVGHYLGLDVHDTPTIPYTRRLQAGVVFPLEPGIYFRSDLANLGISKEFMGIGMRVEDDFVMTNDGSIQNLKHVELDKS
ncbi:unnamed protein product [Trichobilharzia regenti]|nr:unnamed protein product [Trichobilharzia regenti]